MTQFIKYPSIDQFRNAVKTVQSYAKWNDIEPPTIKFTGTVKLHGTNAAIGWNPKTKESWVQSSSRIISVGDDNAGFAAWFHTVQTKFDAMMDMNDFSEEVIVFGEWCGGNIQKGIGLNGLEKMFVVFNVLIGDTGWHLDHEIANDLAVNIDGVYNINNFPRFEMDIDFSKPEYATEELIKITETVESECPVAKAFGIDNGTGEGVVWSAIVDNNRIAFKVKGEKHSSSKVKVLAQADIEKMESVAAFVEYAVTENRLQQGLKEVFGDEEFTQRQTGDFVRWVANDVLKEETDTFTGNGLVWKDVASHVAKAASKWFLERV